MFKEKSKPIMLLIVALLVISYSSLFAQPSDKGPECGDKDGSHHGFPAGHGPMIPGLTDEQKEEIKNVSIEHLKAITPLKNEMGEKKARLRTLSTSDKVNMTEINKVIDDIGKLHTKLLKLKMQHRQDIRNLLTDEQRVFFDAHQPSHEGGKHHKGPPPPCKGPE